VISRFLRRIPPLETALIVLACAALVAAGALGSASTPPAPDTYSSYDVSSGGYGAYYQLLKREGIDVDRFERRAIFLDHDIDTLAYAEPLWFDPNASGESEASARAIDAWVRGGGHFVYFGHDNVAASKGILKLPFSRAWSPRPGRRSVAASLRAFGVENITSADRERWDVAHRADVTVLVDDGRGPLVVRYSLGRGSVVATIDESLFDNAGIALGDRARLAYALTLPPSRGVVAFDESIHGHLVPEHWWNVVPRSFAIALGIAVVAILVAIAGAAVRLGPPLPPTAGPDRTTADFIDGLSTLLERGGAANTALADATRSASHAIAHATGVPDGAPREQLAARIDAAELRSAFIEMTAASAEGDDAAQFVRRVALAQRLRKEYSAHGPSRY